LAHLLSEVEEERVQLVCCGLRCRQLCRATSALKADEPGLRNSVRAAIATSGLPAFDVSLAEVTSFQTTLKTIGFPKALSDQMDQLLSDSGPSQPE
jgi:hypothetical protein